jgi:hypothetical protein
MKWKESEIEELWTNWHGAGQRYSEDPCTFARQELQFSPDARQAEVLAAPMHRVLLCCSRQWGKSTVSAIVATHHLLNHPNAFVAVLCSVERQAAELIRKVRGHLNKLGTKFRSDGIHRHSIQLTEGARMIAIPCVQESCRGLSEVTLLIVDEAAQVDDEVYDALRPSLAVSRGAIWLISTPFGKRGFFWEAWASQGAWNRIAVTARDCPRLSPEFLREEFETRGEHRYQQEYECQFLDDADSLFDVDLLLTNVTADFQPLEPRCFST